MDTGYVWDEHKYEITKQKHTVIFSEVVSAMEDPNSYEEIEEINQQERWISIGKTYSDRILVVIFTEEDLPLYRIITAFDAKGKYLNDYQNRP